jgi:transcriptional regulator with XRE-family HTH domain
MEKSLYSDNQKKLLELLRELREEAKLRQEDVAEALEVPQSFVSKYESGERRLDILELRAVCQVLKLELPTFCRKLERRIAEDD